MLFRPAARVERFWLESWKKFWILNSKRISRLRKPWESCPTFSPKTLSGIGEIWGEKSRGRVWTTTLSFSTDLKKSRSVWWIISRNQICFNILNRIKIGTKVSYLLEKVQVNASSILFLFNNIVIHFLSSKPRYTTYLWTFREINCFKICSQSVF